MPITPSTAIQIAAGATTIAGMIATPLARPRGVARRRLSSVVVTGLFATTAARVGWRWGAPRAASSVVAIAGATALVEHIGTATGVPFGRYRYTNALRPQIGGVPAIVPLAWFAMAVPAREAARAALGRHDSRARRIVVGSFALTAWDLFLDPQMVGEGYWRWARRGRYRGIPLTNFVGWFVTGLGVMAALEALLPPDDDIDPVLAGEYGLMATMETLGFAAFFRDRTVAAVGGAAMLPIVAAGTRPGRPGRAPAAARPAARVVVVGGGVGGLAVAIRLAAAGHRVTVLERNDVAGGKLATIDDEGYTFDVGPSLLTLPHVLDETFACAGTTLADEVDLVRLDPQFRYHWPDGSMLEVPDDAAALADRLEALAPGAGDAWRRFDRHAGRIWDVSERTFFAGPMDDPLDLARRLRSPLDLVAIDPMRTLHDAAAARFDDPRLQQWIGRYATYSGSSPYRAPATLACIPHIEQRYGCWYPMGGLGTVRDALVRVALQTGVEVRTGAEVERVVADRRAVHGVELTGGERIDAEIVIANADARHLYADLLPDDAALRRVQRARPSTSGLVICAGVRGTTPGVGHHNIWFSGDDAAEFAALDAGRMADDPTIYACVSSVTDPSQAPAGCENWFLLVNTPAGAELDPDAAADRVLGQLAARGVDLRPRVQVRHVLTPADFEARYRSPGGAIYGTSSNGRRAAFVRPANRGTRRGLYLVGGSSHPGGGLPLVTMSARIVADMVATDLYSGGAAPQ